jgi:hypothetical protein
MTLQRALPVDVWLGQADARQLAFYRQQGNKAFHALLIDNGYVFNGPHWEFNNAPHSGIYYRPFVYQGGSSRWNETVERIAAMDTRKIRNIFKSVPTCWLATEDVHRLETLCDEMIRRRRKIRSLMGMRLKYLEGRTTIAA